MIKNIIGTKVIAQYNY